MGTGILATIGDTPKIANVSDAKESEQACRMIAPDSWTLPTLSFVPVVCATRGSATAELLDFPARKTYTAADMLRGCKSLS
jgi:hypothetical protein